MSDSDVKRCSVWPNIYFYTQVFFNNGTPQPKFPKSAVVITGLLANQFLRKVVDPRKWFDVDLAGPPLETKPEPRKRSRRIAFEQQKKQIFQELKVHNDKENKRRDQELKLLRADQQRRRRDHKSVISGF